MLYESLKEIEHMVEDDEYTEDGVTYYIAIWKKLKSMNVEELREALLDCEVDIKDDSVNPSEIEDRTADFSRIQNIWHFKDESADKLMNIINEADKYYSLFDKDNHYYSTGAIIDFFRIVKKGNEIILIEFYACD